MPKVTLTSAKKPAGNAITTALLNTRGTAKPGGIIEWDITSHIALTDAEKAALCRKHGTKAPNLKRAAEVKELIMQGNTGVQIAAILRLRHRGEPGYGARMIQKDHATLSKAGEGFKTAKNTALRS